MATRIPFRIDRTHPRALVRQMTDGLRDAIVTGYYKPGDMLPTIHEWTRALDVSIRVPEGALANLVKEGYVVTRPRQGCMVMPREGRRVWRGHVLFVRPVDISCHFVSEEIFAAEERLSLDGYLVTTVVVRQAECGIFDLSGLEQEMARNVSLVIVFGNQPQILDFLSKSDKPFMHVDFGSGVKAENGCVGHVAMSSHVAVEDFVAHCVRADIRHVSVVGKVEDRHVAAAMLEARGIRVSVVDVDAAFGPQRVENLERETCLALDRLFDEHGRKWLPDLIYVEDDYQAIGALFSLLSHGVKIPKDVFFVIARNFGNGPEMPMALTCIEFAPAAAGAEVGRAAVGFLGGKGFSYDSTSAFRYVIGASFPESDCNLTTNKRSESNETAKSSRCNDRRRMCV